MFFKLFIYNTAYHLPKKIIHDHLPLGVRLAQNTMHLLVYVIVVAAFTLKTPVQEDTAKGIQFSPLFLKNTFPIDSLVKYHSDLNMQPSNFSHLRV